MSKRKRREVPRKMLHKVRDVYLETSACSECGEPGILFECACSRLYCLSCVKGSGDTITDFCVSGDKIVGCDRCRETKDHYSVCAGGDCHNKQYSCGYCTDDDVFTECTTCPKQYCTECRDTRWQCGVCEAYDFPCCRHEECQDVATKREGRVAKECSSNQS